MPKTELSRREREVLYYLASGLVQREIAERLGIAVGTVSGYVLRASKKLGTRTQTATVGRAIQDGHISTAFTRLMSTSREGPLSVRDAVADQAKKSARRLSG